jgi:hypothetical protein
MRMSDERLHLLGDIYQANPWLRASGITFIAFLASPEAYLFPRAAEVVGEAAPLLPAQERVRVRLEAIENLLMKFKGDSVPVRNGNYFEKLRHRALPR